MRRAVVQIALAWTVTSALGCATPAPDLGLPSADRTESGLSARSEAQPSEDRTDLPPLARPEPTVIAPEAPSEPPPHRDPALDEALALVDLAYAQLETDAGTARPRLERAIVLLERIRPRQTRALAFAVGLLADCALREDRTAEAEQHYRRAIALLERQEQPALLGGMHGNLASLYARSGRHGEAVATFERAIDYLTEARSEPKVIARLWFESGASYAQLGHSDDAVAHFERALAIRERVLDPNHPDLARSLDGLGAMLLERAQYDRARALLERAVAIHEQRATQPVELGASLSYLGRVYAAQNEFEAARRTLASALALIEPALGKLDPLTLATRASYENAQSEKR